MVDDDGGTAKDRGSLDGGVKEGDVVLRVRIHVVGLARLGVGVKEVDATTSCAVTS